MPVGPGFWFLGHSIWVARRGVPTSAKAWGTVPTMAPPPLEMDEELAQWLQQEEVVAEEVWLGWDTATLEVVMETTGLQMQGQLEGFGGPS